MRWWTVPLQVMAVEEGKEPVSGEGEFGLKYIDWSCMRGGEQCRCLSPGTAVRTSSSGTDSPGDPTSSMIRPSRSTVLPTDRTEGALECSLAR